MSITTKTTRFDFQKAYEIAIESTPLVGQEQVGIINSLGRTLAENVVADINVPDCDVAIEEGYAVLSSETRGVSEKEPKSLSILTESLSAQSISLDTGTTMRVQAGTPLPSGADAVVGYSNTYRPTGGPELLVLAEVKKGENVQPAGSFIKRGELVAEKGTVIGGSEMGLLASVGRFGIAVSRKPRVAVITTGALVADVVEDLQLGERRNIARYAVVGMVLESGCELGRLIHVREGRIGLERALAQCANCDAIVTVLGPDDKHDMAAAALGNVGNVYFDRVYVEPGAMSIFGTVEGRPVFVTSANAYLEIFEALIRPSLLAMLGRKDLQRQAVRAVLKSRLKVTPGSYHYIKAATKYDGNGYITRPLSGYDSDARPWTLPDSLIMLNREVESVKRDEVVDVIIFNH